MSTSLRQHSVRVAACAGGLLVLGAMSVTPTTSSFYYDLETATSSLEAGEWAAAPAECDVALKHPHATTIAGTPGDDVMNTEGKNGQYAQGLLGLAGQDTLSGGNQHDCLVGGLGNDTLSALGAHNGHEDGKDVLLGGPGNDTLIGGNGKDYIDGGPGDADKCQGGNGPNTVMINCELNLDGMALTESATSEAEGPDAGLTSESEPETSEESESEETKDKQKKGDESGSEQSANGAESNTGPSAEGTDQQLTEQSGGTQGGEPADGEQGGDAEPPVGEEFQGEKVQEETTQQDSTETPSDPPA